VLRILTRVAARLLPGLRLADHQWVARSPERGYGLALGTLDTDPGLRPERHVFVANKAPWFEITDALPQHQGWPPVEWPVSTIGSGS
jgi:hypothetical protein